jgi:fibro-slime domain-containing protein
MQTTRISVLAITLSASVSIAGCSGSTNDSQSAAAIAVAGAASSAASGGSGGATTALGSAGSIAQAGGVSLNLPDDMGPGMAGSPGVGGAPSEPYPDTLPDGFTAANMLGGYRVGDEISPNAEAPTDNPDAKLEGCGTTILAVVRDFQADGKNFESLQWGDDRNLVSPTLGPDRKPVFAPSGPTYTVADPEQFNNWYRTVDGLNRAYKLELWFAPNNGVSSFQSTSFFPLDGKGFGEGSTDHNFYFTTEIHTRFKYQGGESFRFTGDDDVWVFINDKLAIDLGGVHPAEDASIDIDARAAELGLVKGKVYAFDMFQNERHTYESNFRADTNLNFVDCGTIVPELPVIPK